MQSVTFKANGGRVVTTQNTILKRSLEAMPQGSVPIGTPYLVIVCVFVRVCVCLICRLIHYFFTNKVTVFLRFKLILILYNYLLQYLFYIS